MTYEVREDGVYVDGTRIYARMEGGYLFCMVRARDEATFWAVGSTVGLTVVNDAGETVPHHNITLVTEKDGVPRPALVPAVEVDGVITTPPVFDSRFHANFWLNPDAVAGGAWETWGKQWTLNGQDVLVKNADENAKAMNNVELIDPYSVNSQSNVKL